MRRWYAVAVLVYVPHAHLFVDESKAKGYYIAVAAVAPADVVGTDRAIRQLTRPGQRRIHFKSEKDSSRRQLLSQFGALGVKVVVYATKGLSDKDARARCLQALVADATAAEADRLILERDESIMAADRRILREALVDQGYGALQYLHATPTEHALLWVSDAVAWCYQARGDWIRRASPLVTHVRNLA